MNSINILGKNFKIIDSIDRITIADSFVVRQNKIGTANGEAKLYLGHDSKSLREFFGLNGFKIDCFLLKADLLKYLSESKDEYLTPEQNYIRGSELPSLWEERLTTVERQNQILQFELIEQSQIAGPRVYAKSDSPNYELIRQLSLPNISYISIIKIQQIDTGKIFYYFRLFVDFFGQVEHPYFISKVDSEIDRSNIDNLEKQQLKNARIGQGEYRRKLLELCPICPITLIGDDRLLIASHIKPWSRSSDFEKIDPLNGFMFTPTYDYLFDRGFISFTDDKRLLLSPFLSNLTYSKLRLFPNKSLDQLNTQGKEKYLEYHRNNIFRFPSQ